MDQFSVFEKRLRDIKSEMVTEIRSILHSKGYGVGSTCFCPGTNTKFEIEYDRVLINNYHPDNMTVDDVLKAVRSAIHVIKKY